MMLYFGRKWSKDTLAHIDDVSSSVQAADFMPAKNCGAVRRETAGMKNPEQNGKFNFLKPL